MRKTFRILTLDGGGVRGVLTIALLERLERVYPQFLQYFDFICGTSAGGILALMLASGYSVSDCRDIYEFSMPEIFTRDRFRIYNPFLSKYDHKRKEDIMKYYFGANTSMGDMEKVAAVIAFRLDGRKSHTHSFFDREGWRPAVFSNMPRGFGLIEPDLDLKVSHRTVFQTKY